MDSWQLSVIEVVPHLQQWGHTTTVMRLRIMDPTAGPVTREGDIYLFAMAARQTLGCVATTGQWPNKGESLLMRKGHYVEIS